MGPAEVDALAGVLDAGSIHPRPRDLEEPGLLREHLDRVLTELSAACFSGKLGLSVDKFHGIRTAHLAEFWTDDTRSEGLLGALGWRRVFERDNYMGRRHWSLMEKAL